MPIRAKSSILLRMRSARYTYTFTLWPDQAFGHCRALFLVMECMGTRIELDLSEIEFSQLRSNLAADGFLLQEIERVPYRIPESIA